MLRLIRDLINSISALSNEIHAAREQRVGAQDKAHNGNPGGDPIQPIRVELLSRPDPPKEVTEYYEGENRNRDSWWARNKWKFELAGIGAGLVLLIININQACSAKDAASAAKSAADTAAKELELSQRPWVVLKLAVGGPITFDANGANLNLIVTLSNVGHSPAEQINFVGIALNELWHPPNQADIQQRTSCPDERLNLNPRGEPLVVGDPSEHSIGFVIPRAQISDSVIPNTISPVLTGCIDYKFLNKAYRTGFRYEFVMPLPTGGVGEFRAEETITPSSIRINKYLVPGNYVSEFPLKPAK